MVLWLWKVVYSIEAHEESLHDSLNDGETHPGKDCFWIHYDGATDEEDCVGERDNAVYEERTAIEQIFPRVNPKADMKLLANGE